MAAVYFVGEFVQNPQLGLPDIPTVLLVLAGLSAASYVSNKAIAEGTPQLTGIYPAKGPVGAPVKIFGTALLYPKQLGTEAVDAPDDAFHEVQVTIGGLPADVVAGSLSHSRGGDDRLEALPAATLEPGKPHEVKLLNFRGTASNALIYELLGTSAAGGGPAAGAPAAGGPAA